MGCPVGAPSFPPDGPKPEMSDLADRSKLVSSVSFVRCLPAHDFADSM